MSSNLLNPISLCVVRWEKLKKSYAGKLLAICLVLFLIPLLYYASISAKKPDYKAKMPKASPLPTLQKNSKLEELVSNVYAPNETQRPGPFTFYRSVSLAKTDGHYIYQINGMQVNIINASPTKMKMIKTLEFSRPKVNAIKNIHVNEDHCVIVGVEYKKTIAFFYDVSDKDNIRKIREIKLDGDYVSSQVIGGHFYLLANQYVDAFQYLENKNAAIPAPSYRDSIAGKATIRMDLKDVNYLPNSSASDYLVVLGLNLDEPKEKAKVNAYFGAGVKTYTAGSNIYVPVRHVSKTSRPETVVFKFELYEGKPFFTNKGVVAGALHTRIAINEHKDNLRIATSTVGARPTNSIHILDKNMKTIGSIHGLTRAYPHFAGDRAYLENFRIPPLIAVDLKDPRKIKLLGPLKVPLSAAFFNPYQNGQYIGLGDTYTETGRVNGMKLMVTDHSDAGDLRVISDLTLGDRGTYGSIAMLDKSRKLLAVSIHATKLKELKPPIVINGRTHFDEDSDTGKPIFDGAYIYTIDQTEGLLLKGEITHLTNPGSINKTENNSFEQSINNVLIINDMLYAISPGRISVHDISTLKQIRSFAIKLPTPSHSRDNLSSRRNAN